MTTSIVRSRIARLALGAACFSAAALADAATTVVSPGTNTLQTAITAAASGDVLELLDGTYVGVVNVTGKNLTLRARAGTTPVIPNNVQISSAHRLVLQGLTFSNKSRVYTSNANATLAVLQSTFKDSSIHCEGAKCIVIGNNFDPQTELSTYDFTRNLIGSQNTSESVFAGNEMQSRARSVFSYAYFHFSGGSSQIIGNKFRLDTLDTSYQNSDFAMFRIDNGVAAVTGNRFELFIDGSRNQNNIYSPSAVRVGNATATFRNNTFTLESASAVSLITTGYRVSALRALSIVPAGGEVRLYNNVFDYRNISFGASVNPAQGAVYAQRYLQAVSGNIFQGIQHGAVELAAGVFANISDNLCYQIGGTCPGANALTANPLFMNAAAGDYHLLAGSPAINAGPSVPVLNDIDGSRNDLGVHGGPFDLDQFDVQRAPSLQPFVYPLFEANKAIDGNGKLQIRLIGVARNQ